MDKMDFIAALAQELGVKYSNRRKWFERGHVPWKWRPRMHQLAIDKGRPLNADDMECLIPKWNKAA